MNLWERVKAWILPYVRKSLNGGDEGMPHGQMSHLSYHCTCVLTLLLYNGSLIHLSFNQHLGSGKVVIKEEKLNY